MRVIELSNHPGDMLTDAQQAEIQRLIQQDHDFHHKRRRTGPSPPR